jgi:hypothetical protein
MPAQATYTPIATQTLVSNVGLVTFDNIPQTYTDLVLFQSARVTNGSDITAIRINDAATGYSKQYLEGNGSNNTAGTGNAEIALRAGYIPGTTYANVWSSEEYTFYHYRNTTIGKSVFAKCSYPVAQTSFAMQFQQSNTTVTAAITKITIQTANGGNLATGSTFTLYGIEAA